MKRSKQKKDSPRTCADCRFYLRAYEAWATMGACNRFPPYVQGSATFPSDKQEPCQNCGHQQHWQRLVSVVRIPHVPGSRIACGEFQPRKGKR